MPLDTKRQIMSKICLCLLIDQGWHWEGVGLSNLDTLCRCSTAKDTFLKEKIAAQSVASIQPVLFCVAVSGQIY